MKTKSLIKFLCLICFIIFTMLFQTCGNDVVSPASNYIAGTITYTDAGFNNNGGYYAVSFYVDSSYPFTRAPVRSDSVGYTINGNSGSAYFKSFNLDAGDYYIGATWVRRSDGTVYVLGTYGCDTVGAGCNPTKITYPNYAGTGNLDFHSFTSIYRALYHHP